MNTTFDFTLSVASGALAHAQEVLLESHRRVEQLERELSEFLAGSPVSQLNAAAPEQRISVPRSVLSLLEQGSELGSLSGGAFDYAVKGAREAVPSFAWDVERGEAWRRGPNEKLSFAAIGKGYALDEVRCVLEREGFADYVLSAGGSSLVFSGFQAERQPWEFAWAWQRGLDGKLGGTHLHHTLGRPMAVGVSGTLEQGCHLVDPRTALPSTACKSAFVAASKATDADALSTALFVSGWEIGNASLEKRREFTAAAIVDGSGMAWWNRQFEKVWGALAVLVLCGTLNASDESIDLNDLGTESFAPYAFDRDIVWILLPLLSLVLVLIHLKKNPKNRSERI